MIFAQRESYHHSIRGAGEAVAFAHYLRSRNRYKLDLIDRVAGEVGDGPLLDWSGGYGSFGCEVVRQRPVPAVRVCTDIWSSRLARRPGDSPFHVTVRASGDHLPFQSGSFQVVVSVNFLHEWDRPDRLLVEIYRLLAPGGVAVVNDLRRDAEPFLVEYVLRELAGGHGRRAEVGARAFARSLRSAYTPAEIREALTRDGPSGARVEDEDPMTLTVWLTKGSIR
jgi:SAM-dependent methyltransferase